MKAWHFVGDTLRNGGPIPADGELLAYNGNIKMCESGLHASIRLIDALKYAPGSTICRVDCDTIMEKGNDKLVCGYRTILWRVGGEELLRKFARLCALDVVDAWDCPSIVLQWLRGDFAAESAAGSAAKFAAESAAWSAAEFAAWSAAKFAAESAAWSAAEFAAWSAAKFAAKSAAEFAAEFAAWSAAWSAATRSAAESAAESAAWSATRSAAGSAAKFAAESAAESKQNARLVRMVRATHNG